MRSLTIALAAAGCLVAIAQALAATAEAGTIAQYRAYAAAIRNGQLDAATKLVEPVPESCKPLLDARLKQAISVEALKKEMIAQMGPPKIEEDGWNIGGLPYDDLLQNLKGVAQGESVMVMVAKNPRTNEEATAAWMVRRNGKWFVPAAMVMDVQPPEDQSAAFVEPDADDRDESIKYADATRKAAEAVLKRLRNKEFTKPAEVSAALSEETRKLRGK